MDAGEPVFSDSARPHRYFVGEMRIVADFESLQAMVEVGPGLAILHLVDTGFR